MMELELDAEITKAISRAYGLSIRGTEHIGGGRGGRAYRLDTDRGPLCLKWHAPSVDAERVLAMADLVEHLARGGFHKTPPIFRTLEGQGALQSEQGLFSLSEWIEGRPYTNGEGYQNLIGAARSLAQFHLAARGFQEWTERFTAAAWLEARRHIAERLIQAQRTYQVRGARSAFEEGVLSIIPGYIRRAEEEVILAERAQGAYQAVYNLAYQERGVIHGDFGGVNLTLRPGGEVFILDWEEWLPDLRWVNDLCNLTWVFGAPLAAVAHALSAYHAIYPIQEEEVAVLPIFLSPVGSLAWLIDHYQGEATSTRSRWCERYLERRLTPLERRLEIVDGVVAHLRRLIRSERARPI